MKVHVQMIVKVGPRVDAYDVYVHASSVNMVAI